MTAALPMAIAYVAQLWLKGGLALWQRARERAPTPSDLGRLTIIQPVTSGDETLRAVLLQNLRAQGGAPRIWILDRTDDVARALCQALKAEWPDCPIAIVETAEPPPGFNPKLWKQAAALPLVTTELLAVIDDDTWVPPESLDCLIGALDAGATIATGLPKYVAARGLWSVLVAEFVNSAAILTYLSASACSEPLSINGMCYALRTDYVREHDLFTSCGRAITDDLAIAKEIRGLGGRIVQTTRPQKISTSVRTGTHYRRLMHRWFVFSRILVQNESVLHQALLVVSYGLHPLLLIALFVSAGLDPGTGLGPLVVVLVVRAASLTLLNRRFTGSWRHAPLASVAAELLQPGFFLGAFLRPVIWWRHRKIRVRRFDNFEYLSP
jgi:ceramide glucosyltransferase